MTAPEGFTAAAAAGLSTLELADRFGVAPRTVRRWRSQTGARYTPTPPRHGSRARYRGTPTRPGCSCRPCRAANAAETAAHRAVYARSRLTRQEAPRA